MNINFISLNAYIYLKFGTCDQPPLSFSQRQMANRPIRVKILCSNLGLVKYKVKIFGDTAQKFIIDNSSSLGVCLI